MNLENIVIVLCRPEESRNVGAVCRAMANNGIHTLRIVGKKEDFDFDPPSPGRFGSKDGRSAERLVKQLYIYVYI